MVFSLFGKKKTHVEKYREKVSKVLERMENGHYKVGKGYEKLESLREEIYRYSISSGDESCLELWDTIFRIQCSFVGEEQRYLGRRAKEEIHHKERMTEERTYYNERIGTVLDIGLQQMKSTGGQLEARVESVENVEPGHKLDELETVLSPGNGNGK